MRPFRGRAEWSREFLKRGGRIERRVVGLLVVREGASSRSSDVKPSSE